MKHELGKCPKCKSENIDYGDDYYENNHVSYATMCCDCNWEGIEVHELEFQGYYESGTGELA